jgi:hypothetical protein
VGFGFGADDEGIEGCGSAGDFVAFGFDADNGGCGNAAAPVVKEDDRDM